MVKNDLWERAVATYLATLNSEDKKNQASRLFSMVTNINQEGMNFHVFTKNNFSADLLTREYATSLQTCLSLVAGNENSATLVFSVNENIEQTIIFPKLSQTKNFKNEKSSTFISTMPLNDEYTFDEFVQGPSNSWAYASAIGVVNNLGKIGYNPLFIHGGTGLGKTHLMQAIGNEVRKKMPQLAVCYLTAETFLNEYVNSMQKKDGDSFRDKYRNVDLLLVDDVQFLQKGNMVQDEFFNTFNSLIGKHKQIVMTSDVAPKDLSVLEERLISRFEGGIVQEIESPKYETRLAILRKKTESITPKIPEACIRFIAEHIKSHVRAMEGALGKVKIMIAINPSIDLSDEMLSRLLKDFIEKEKTQKKVTVEEIQAAVAKEYCVTVDQILKEDRTASIVTPRQLSMYITRKFINKSLPMVAKDFKRSHATVIHGVKTISKRLDVEDDLKNTFMKIISELGFSTEDNLDYKN